MSYAINKKVDDAVRVYINEYHEGIVEYNRFSLVWKINSDYSGYEVHIKDTTTGKMTCLCDIQYRDYIVM